MSLKIASAHRPCPRILMCAFELWTCTVSRLSSRENLLANHSDGARMALQALLEEAVAELHEMKASALEDY